MEKEGQTYLQRKTSNYSLKQVTYLMFISRYDCMCTCKTNDIMKELVYLY